MARLRLLLPVVAAIAALAAAPAQADLGGLLGGVVTTVDPQCGVGLQPFAQFGDDRTYYAIPNNGFELGSTGWTLSRGASVVQGNEPWFVSEPGSHSLSLPAGSSVLGPPSCIGTLDPTLRLFAASKSANGGLRIQVLLRGLTGNLLGVLDVSTLAPGDYPDWSPTDDVPSAGALPLLTRSFQLRVTAAQSSGVWQIDDVFVDPFISRVG